MRYKIAEITEEFEANLTSGGVSKAELAAWANYHVRTVERYFEGSRTPDPGMAILAALIRDVPGLTDYIRGGPPPRIPRRRGRPPKVRE
jgi:hypothetical protein